MSAPEDAADEPGPVRRGEELDEARLADYLRAALRLEGPLEVRQFASGYSNLTYLVRCGGRELVLRRPPAGSRVKTAHDMGREHFVLARLAPVYELAPRPLAACDDPAVLGFPFYLMKRVPGVILRRALPPGFALPPESARRLAEALIANLAHLHALDWRALGLGELARPGSYAARQVRGWTERYHGSQTDELPDLEAAAAWLAANLPPESDAALVHNDYKHDNLVLDPQDPTRIRAVLDWEMATVGDPLMDLGTTLGYWVEAGDPEALRALAFGPTALPGTPSRAELAALYAAASGRDLARLPFYYAFGLFKIAVIAQQIYYRWRQGLTADPRFAALLPAIRTLGRQAARVAETDSLSPRSG
ncbi:MAG TPA: phosphotransferase family protein [Thermoanaerobaculia bacterium]|nr:phosphotransferase family protein [Thermoanaerobaculia bacterium]